MYLNEECESNEQFEGKQLGQRLVMSQLLSEGRNKPQTSQNRHGKTDSVGKVEPQMRKVDVAGGKTVYRRRLRDIRDY